MRELRHPVLLAVCAALVACAEGLESPPGLAEAEQASRGAQARLVLHDTWSLVDQTSGYTWSLEKTGSVDPTARTVTWNLVASRSSTPTRQLIVHGQMWVKNTGHVPATIGNVVLHLQHQPHAKWHTLASNVADATLGDAATTATIIDGGPRTITENAASGTLTLHHTITNMPLAVPQLEVPPHGVVPLWFTATFDNDVLNLPTWRRVRAEMIVTFGNAGPGQGSTAHVDIDGSGTLDPDENRVASAAERFMTWFVPPTQPSSTSATLSDTVEDLSTTGTVTFADPVFQLGAGSGTVTVTYAGGDAGGTLTNCAHLVTDTGELEACDTQVIAPDPRWQDGDLVTHAQGPWGDTPTATNAAGLLLSHYDLVYGASSGLLEVGIPGPSGFSMQFTNPTDLLAYLPAVGPSGPLTSDVVNPMSTVAGAFAGDVLALRLNVDFSDAGALAGTAPIAFGDVTLCGFPTLPLLEGRTVRELLAELESLLGGGPGVYDIGELTAVLANLNVAFAGGTVSAFADDHLVIGSCP